MRPASGRVFAPILAGATARDRAVACVAAAVAIGLVAVEGALVHGSSWTLPRIAAPVGASAVLVFVVPASPMAQPWPVVGGNAISAAVGLLVAAGWAFPRFSGHTYPHHAATAPAPRADPLPSERVGLRDADVDAVLHDLHETFDIDPADLRVLVRELERRVLARERAELTCEAVMSRDLLTVRRDTDPATAEALLLQSGVRLLPVIDGDGRPVGGVGLRELARPAARVGDVMTPAVVIGPSRSVVELVGPLTDEHRHAAMVVDDGGRLVGLVSQADLLAALARPRAIA